MSIKNKITKCSILISLIAIILLLTQISSADNGKIKGTVFDDKNCNGERNGGEMGIPGVLITLNPGSKTDTTNNKGRFEFKKLKEGTYTVIETDPAGYCSTTPNTIIVNIKKKHKKKKDNHKSSDHDDGDHDDDDSDHDDGDHDDDDGDHDFGDSRKSISPPAGCCLY